eukprot:jgi/Tetstr1/453959/TSEL_040878.t1
MTTRRNAGVPRTQASSIKAGTYRSLSLNDTPVSDAFSRMVIARMTQRGVATTDEKHWSLGEMLDEFSSGNINVYPDYQRGMVATVQWARELIGVCMLTSAPIAPIYLYATPTGCYEVVDGAQRLAAYFLFMMGAFPVVDDAGTEWWFCSGSDPCHWTRVLGGPTHETGVAALIDDSPVPEAIRRFHSQTRPFLKPPPADAALLSGEIQGRLRGRKQSIVVMPKTWDRELAILYTVFTGLKAWRQTKDECLVHMHDHASRALKALEPDLVQALAEAGVPFSSPTRQVYGVLVRTFACLENFSHVPVEQDERLYVDLMMKLAADYATAAPPARTIAALRKGVDWLHANGAALMSTLPPRPPKITPDTLCALLYTASSRSTFRVKSMVTMVLFVSATKPKRLLLLRGGNIANADEILNDYQAALDRRRASGSTNLAELCATASRLVN